MTDDLVAQARALDAAATPGPWTVDEEGWIDEQPTALLIYGGGPRRSLSEHCCALVGNYGQGVEECEADAKFIAASRSLLPAIADELEAEREKVGRLVAALRAFGALGAARALLAELGTTP